MPNELENFDLTVESRIDDKVNIYSIAKEDVGNSIREGAALARLFPALDSSRTYPKDWPGRDSAYNLFVSLADDVSGDTTIGANWQLVSSASGNAQVYDLAATNLSDVLESTSGAISAYGTNKIYIVTPNSPVAGPSTYEINALGDLPIKKLVSGAYIDTASGDLAGTTILLYRTSYFLIAGGSSSGGSGSGNTTTATAIIECDGSSTDYTVVNPLNNADVIVMVRYDNSSPYGMFYPPITISAGFIVVDLSTVPIGVFDSYKVIVTGQDLN